MFILRPVAARVGTALLAIGLAACTRQTSQFHMAGMSGMGTARAHESQVHTTGAMDGMSGLGSVSAGQISPATERILKNTQAR